MNHNAMDAQAAYSFLVSKTTHIERQVNETVYPEIQYPDLVPVDTSAAKWADTVTFYSADKFGKADWINGNASDIPTVGREFSEHKSNIFMAGVGYDYGYEEIQRVAMQGGNLTADKAMAARRAYEEFVDKVTLYGDAAKNFDGLLSHDLVAAVAAVNGDWGNANTTEQQILEDVNKTLLRVPTDTKQISMADTLLLPYDKFIVLGTRRLGDTSMTILDFIRKNNVYTLSTNGGELRIVSVRGLETAGAGGVSRMVAYRRNPDVLKLHIPMPHEFLPVHKDGPLHYTIPGIFRLGGLEVRRPKEITYTDGI